MNELKLKRQGILMAHEYALKQQKNIEIQARLSEIDMFKNYNEMCYQHLSMKGLMELKSIKIKDLKGNQINYGMKLYCKIIAKPRGYINISTIIEDKFGDVMPLTIYNMTSILTGNVDEMGTCGVKMGTKLIIKEPYCMYFNEHTMAIRVDNCHTNIVVIRDDIEKIKNEIKMLNRDEIDLEFVNMVKDKGNKYFKNGKYHGSLLFYDNCILLLNDMENENNRDEVTQMKKKVYNNRSLCYLKMKKYDLAINEAKLSVELDTNWVKPVYNMCLSMYYVNKINEAFNAINKFKKDNNNAQCKQMVCVYVFSLYCGVSATNVPSFD